MMNSKVIIPPKTNYFLFEKEVELSFSAIFSAMVATMRREFRVYTKSLRECTKPWAVFFLCTMLFPISLPLNPNLLSMLSPGIFWIAALLSILTTQDSLLNADESEEYEHLLLSPYPLSLLLFSKLLIHWGMIGLPILISIPVLSLFLNINGSGFCGVMLTLSIGIPVLCLLNALGSALTLGLKQSGLLLALITVPWMLPVLMIGTHGANAAMEGTSYLADVLLLFAFLIGLCPLVPMIMSWTLKMRVESNY